MTYTRHISTSLLATGLAGTLGYRVVNATGTVKARATAGVTERGTSAIYVADVAGWDTAWGETTVVWDAGDGDLAEDLWPPYFPPVTADGYMPADVLAVAGTEAVQSTDPPVATDSDGRVTLAPAGLDDVVVEAGVNARQALSPILAAAAGVLSGAGTGTIVVKSGGGSVTRITASTDNVGNRTSVTLALPA